MIGGSVAYYEPLCNMIYCWLQACLWHLACIFWRSVGLNPSHCTKTLHMWFCHNHIKIYTHMAQYHKLAPNLLVIPCPFQKSFCLQWLKWPNSNSPRKRSWRMKGPPTPLPFPPLCLCVATLPFRSVLMASGSWTWSAGRYLAGRCRSQCWAPPFLDGLTKADARKHSATMLWMRIDRRELRWANLMAMLVPIPNLQSLGFPWLFYLIAVPCCAQVSLALPAGDMVIEGDAGSPQPYPKDFIGFLDFLGILGKDFGAFLRPLIYIYIYWFYEFKRLKYIARGCHWEYRENISKEHFVILTRISLFSRLHHCDSSFLSCCAFVFLMMDPFQNYSRS